MIFVTVGTHHQPFARLLGALGSLPAEELVVQYGPGDPPAGVARAQAYMPFDEMMSCFRRAERVITHAGVGSILCATGEGHVPIVVPRRSDLREHVDEHQAELTRALERRGTVVALWNAERIAEVVAQAPPRRPPAEPSPERARLCAAVASALGPQPSSA